MPKSNCLNCNKEIHYNPSQRRGLYCSNVCQQEYRINEAVATGTYTKANGYSWFKKNTKYECSCCGISEWQGKELRLQIDHIDGNNKNNVIENFRYLCPNCHTQTETWGVKSASDEGKQRIKEAAKLGRAIQLGRVPEGTKLGV